MWADGASLDKNAAGDHGRQEHVRHEVEGPAQAVLLLVAEIDHELGLLASLRPAIRNPSTTAPRQGPGRVRRGQAQHHLLHGRVHGHHGRVAAEVLVLSEGGDGPLQPVVAWGHVPHDVEDAALPLRIAHHFPRTVRSVPQPGRHIEKGGLRHGDDQQPIQNTRAQRGCDGARQKQHDAVGALARPGPHGAAADPQTPSKAGWVGSNKRADERCAHQCHRSRRGRRE
eukprot:scaffold7099_cov281-Pinguiococcus_pyrenoidosus.AAC.35